MSEFLSKKLVRKSMFASLRLYLKKNMDYRPLMNLRIGSFMKESCILCRDVRKETLFQKFPPKQVD